MKKQTSKKNILNIFLGIVFLSAALYRIIKPDAGITEFTELGIPVYFLYLTIVFEIIVGVLFIIGKKIKLASVLTIIFLSGAILLSIITNFSNLVMNLGEIFVFNPTPTDILLHFVYIIALVYVFKMQK